MLVEEIRDYYVHVLFLHVNFIIIITITIIVSGLIIILMRVLRVLWALPTGGCCCAIATFGRMPKQTTSIAPRHSFVPYRVPASFFPLELVGNMCRHGMPHQGRATAWPCTAPYFRFQPCGFASRAWYDLNSSFEILPSPF